MVKLLAFTDPHGELASAKDIVSLARREKPDIIVCAGDISYFGMKYEPFLDELKALGREIYFVPGNHESQEETSRIQLRFSFMKDVTFKTEKVQGVLIAGVTGNDSTYWPGPGDHEGALALAESLWGTLDRSQPLVFLCHYPPSGTRLDGMSQPAPDSGGSVVTREIVERLKPNLVICGHYHQDFRKSDHIGTSRVVNPGPDGMMLEV